jgi:hypothetical protein
VASKWCTMSHAVCSNQPTPMNVHDSSPVGDVGQDRGEHELPDPQTTAAEVRRYRPAAMIALNLRRCGSRISELTPTDSTSMSNGTTTVIT